MISVFVYGSLRPDIFPGFKNQFPTVTFYPAILSQYQLAVEKYPFLIPNKFQEVKGYLLSFRSPNILTRIDKIEGYYTRNKKEIQVPGYYSTVAWVYNIPLPGSDQYRLIASGDWRNKI